MDEMPHLHLPAEHDDHDLQLAGALAVALRSDDLYVTWSCTAGHPARPVVPALLDTRSASEKPHSRSFGDRLIRRFRRTG